MYDFVFFDLDGTLIDSTDAIFEAFRKAFHQLGLAYPGEGRIREEFGKSLHEILSILDIPVSHHDQFKEIFTKTELQSDNFELFDGITEILELVQSKNLPVVFVTSKRRKTANHVFEVTGLGEYVDFLVGADDVERTKPDPEPLFNAKSLLEDEYPDISTGSIVYVGDSIYDMEAALRAEITPIGVYWGTHQTKLVEKYPDQIIVETPSDLYQLLLKRLQPRK